VALDDTVDLSAMLPDDEAFLWSRDGFGRAAWGEAASIEVCRGPDRFGVAARDLGGVFSGIEWEGEGPPPVAFGSFTFDSDAGGSVLVVPSTVLTVTPQGAWLTSSVGDEGSSSVHGLRVAPERHDFKLRYAGSSVSELTWLEAVAGVIGALRGGDLRKVVMARDVLIWSEMPFDVRLLLARLARRFPECYTFACRGLIGASPELLVKRSDRTASSLVLAGSAPRGEGSDDVRLGDELLSSVKDLEEHEIAVRSVTSVYEDLCQGVRTAGPQLLRLANVQHLATDVEGQLRAPLTALEFTGRLHPTAAVCGTPTLDAMATIRSTEGMERGRYAGPVGWVDAEGNGEWAIALRCAEIAGARGRLFAGAGLVGASHPEAELEETRLKFRAMMSVLESAS
jgi:menaquinone-specific isochorismate synthase